MDCLELILVKNQNNIDTVKSEHNPNIKNPTNKKHKKIQKQNSNIRNTGAKQLQQQNQNQNRN